MNDSILKKVESLGFTYIGGMFFGGVSSVQYKKNGKLILGVWYNKRWIFRKMR